MSGTAVIRSSISSTRLLGDAGDKVHTFWAAREYTRIPETKTKYAARQLSISSSFFQAPFRACLRHSALRPLRRMGNACWRKNGRMDDVGVNPSWSETDCFRGLHNYRNFPYIPSI